jgi:hypothetical protein
MSRRRERERETELQINDNIERPDLNDLSEEPTLAAKKSRSDRLASKMVARISLISVNISLSPCAIRSYPTSASSLHLIEYTLAFSPSRHLSLSLCSAPPFMMLMRRCCVAVVLCRYLSPLASLHFFLNGSKSETQLLFSYHEIQHGNDWPVRGVS